MEAVPPSGPPAALTAETGRASQGLNAIVRVDAKTEALRVFRVPTQENSGPHTAVFDRRGLLWFTGAAGYYGRLDPRTGKIRVWRAPRGAGPYGITATPNGDVYFASLQQSYVARIDIDTGKVAVLRPPTSGQGARRVWSDSRGRIWVTEWNAGKLARYDAARKAWKEWRLPGSGPQPYAVYVDARDLVWISDFGANALVSFDSRTEKFRSYRLPSADVAVRQLLGRGRELWGAESAVDKLVVARTR